MAVDRADEQPARCVVVLFPPFLLLDGEGFVGRLEAIPCPDSMPRCKESLP